MLKAFRCLILALCFCVLSFLPSYSFDAQKNVYSHFFWTKSYKEKHKPPVNNMPKTMQDYYRQLNKNASANQDIPAPKFEKDSKLVDLPDPTLTLRKYNNPPGMYDINLNKLKKLRKVNSIGVVSPQFNKMAYSTVFYYPSTKTASSEMYILNLDTSKDIKERVEDAHINNGYKTIYRSEMNNLDLDIQKTLTVVDWSVDGKRIALKEKISYTSDGLWKTNLIVYDLTTGKAKVLNEVRDAIQYYWQTKENINLKDYRWDIYPIGWDAMNHDRIIVFAYAATGEKPKYLGAWSIDYNGDRSVLMSLYGTNFQVSQNGSCLKAELQN